MEHFVTYHTKDGVAIITINRPTSLNALNTNVLQDLDIALNQAEQDRTISVVIITGTGNTFIAGADISEMKDMSNKEAHNFSKLGNTIFDRIEFLSKPVIAAINGFALGGGCELAMACDYRIAARRAKFGQPEVKLGIMPGFGGCKRLVKIVGASKAKELIFSGRVIDAITAEQIGLADEVVDDDSLMNRVLELSASICSNSLFAVQQAKRMFSAKSMAEYHLCSTEEVFLFSRCFEHDDQSEGMNAFLCKRIPQFQNHYSGLKHIHQESVSKF